MGTYSFEDNGDDTGHNHKLERIGFAINQLLDAVEQDAHKILESKHYNDPEIEISLQAELLHFCSLIILDKRKEYLDQIGIEEFEDEGDGEEDYESSGEMEESVRPSHEPAPISLEDVAKFRRMLGNIDKPNNED